MSALLEVRDLRKRFGGVLAVGGLSFQLQSGEVLGIIGPNGAGKTTAISLIGGSIKPDSGAVLLNGRDVTGMAPHRLVQLGLSRTFQSTVVFGEYTVEENCWCGAFLQHYAGFLPTLLATRRWQARKAATAAWIEEVLDWLHLTDIRDATAGQLPYGHQKTLGIAIAVASRPTVVMLDEPVAGLSSAEADRILATITRVRTGAFRSSSSTITCVSCRTCATGSW